MIGKQIHQYKIIERLGEGGMGIVYLAEDTRLKRKVAIKFMPRDIKTDPDGSKRFEIEAQAACLFFSYLVLFWQIYGSNGAYRMGYAVGSI